MHALDRQRSPRRRCTPSTALELAEELGEPTLLARRARRTSRSWTRCAARAMAMATIERALALPAEPGLDADPRPPGLDRTRCCCCGTGGWREARERLAALHAGGARARRRALAAVRALPARARRAAARRLGGRAAAMPPSARSRSTQSGQVGEQPVRAGDRRAGGRASRRGRRRARADRGRARARRAARRAAGRASSCSPRAASSSCRSGDAGRGRRQLRRAARAPGAAQRAARAGGVPLPRPTRSRPRSLAGAPQQRCEALDPRSAMGAHGRRRAARCCWASRRSVDDAGGQPFEHARTLLVLGARERRNRQWRAAREALERGAGALRGARRAAVGREGA